MLLGELAKVSSVDVRCAVREAPPACCEGRGQDLAAQAMMLLAELAKDSVVSVRCAEC